MRFTAPRFIFDRCNLFVARVAFSKLTIAYFVFSVVHCIIQLGLQGRAFSTNAKAAAFLWDIVVQGDATVDGVLDFGTDLEVCDTVENALSHSCQVVWSEGESKPVESNPPPSSIIFTDSSTPPTTSLSPPSTTSIPLISSPDTNSLSIPSESAPTPLPTILLGEPITVGFENSDGTEEYDVIVLKRHVYGGLGKIHVIDSDGETMVEIDGLGRTNASVVLDRKCLIALNWPAAALDNTKREDIVFVAFQFWVLGMSIVAILNESIPHIIASLFTHMVATGWGTFQIIHTNNFRSNFARLTTNGACGINLLPAYWSARRSVEVASLTLNVVALLIGLVLSWRLLKAFGWRTFRRMGACMQIRRQYTAVLVLSVAIQLALFFIVATAGLWLDQLINGVISRIAKKKVVYEVMTIVVLALLIPWLALGWTSVRKEQRILMAVFLGMSVLYLAGWGAMFSSPSFRWTFLEWRFFTLMASASVLLALSALITGLICRLGFGKGLPEHLNETRHTEDEDGLFTAYVQDDASEISIEKVEFPPLGYPVPTFSAAFGSNGAGTLSGKSQSPNQQAGPRFYGSSVPFDQAVPEPTPAHIRQQPPTMTSTTPHLYRYNSDATNHSRASSDTSVESGIGRNGSGRKRWIIE